MNELFQLSKDNFSRKNFSKKFTQFKISNETKSGSKLLNLLTTIANHKISLHSIGPRQINLSSSTNTISFSSSLGEQHFDIYDDLEEADPYHYVTKYNPDVGLRTALVLGSMLISIVLYIIWRNRYQCLGKKNDHLNEDYNLEYWLQQVDKQKLAQSKNNFHTPKLPDIVTDSRQATAAWIFEHQKIWRNLKKARNSPLNWPNRSYYLPVYDRLTNNMNSEGSFHRPLLDRLNLFKRKSELTKKQLNVKAPFRKKSAVHIELDENTQLLINYARVDAKNFRLGRIVQPFKDKSKLTFSIIDSKKEELPNDNTKMHNILINMFLHNRRRRHSWPRCKSDYSHFHSLNKDLRQNYDFTAHSGQVSFKNTNEHDRLCSPSVKVYNSNNNAAASKTLLDTKV